MSAFFFIKTLLFKKSLSKDIILITFEMAFGNKKDITIITF